MLDPAVPEFPAEAFLIDRLQQTRPETAMNPDPQFDDP
jgi:hypothetical protein